MNLQKTRKEIKKKKTKTKFLNCKKEGKKENYQKNCGRKKEMKFIK